MSKSEGSEPFINHSDLGMIFEESLNEIYIIDAETLRFIQVNPAACQNLGYHIEEMKDMTPSHFKPEFTTESFQELIAPLRSGEKKKLNFNTLHQRKDGSTYPVSVFLQMTRIADKPVFMAIILDITEQERMAEQLGERDERLNAIFNTVVDGVITISTRGVIQLMNPAAARLFGYEPEEVVGKRINMLMPEPYRAEHDSYMSNYHNTGTKKIIGIGREVSGLKKNGTIFPFYLSVSEVILKDTTIYTGIIHDLTEQKLAEERMQVYARELERSNRELQDFAYISSHDLQEPLRKIQAFGDRVRLKEREQLSDKGKDYIDRMLNAASRMQKLINDLLSYSRITTRVQAFETISLDEVVAGVLSDLEITIAKNEATIDSMPLPNIEADPTQMRQVLQNLIANAIKFRKEDTPPIIRIFSNTIKKTVQFRKPEGEDFVVIHIEDNGIGFDEKYKDRIFNIFQQLEGRQFEGSGIGLSIVKKIVARHGGQIDVKSEVGEGSQFILTLPVKQQNSNPS